MARMQDDGGGDEIDTTVESPLGQDGQCNEDRSGRGSTKNRSTTDGDLSLHKPYRLCRDEGKKKVIKQRSHEEGFDTTDKFKFADVVMSENRENDVYKILHNNDMIKLFLSFLIWITCYLSMGIIGGSLAFMHFPRTMSNSTEPLPDFGYDAIPYFCPTVEVSPNRVMNVQDFVLAILYWSIIIGFLYRYYCFQKNVRTEGMLDQHRNDNDEYKRYVFLEEQQQPTHLKQNNNNHSTPQSHQMNTSRMIKSGSNVSAAMTTSTSSSSSSSSSSTLNSSSPTRQKKQQQHHHQQYHPRIILQHLLHLDTLLFLTRTSVVCLTGLPQPNPRCIAAQHDTVTYNQAFTFVMLRGFPPHACGDLIYSGHTGCILICMVVLNRHFKPYLMMTMNGNNNNKTKGIRLYHILWFGTVIGILSTISCRSHYTVDVVLAIYFSHGIQEFYFTRSEGLVDGGSVGTLIRWLES